MSKMFKRITIAGLVILLSMSAFAQPRGTMRPERMFNRGGHFPLLNLLKFKQEELNITAEQLEKIELMVKEHEMKMIDMRSAAEKQRLEMRDLMGNWENPDYALIRKALDKSSALHNDMFISRMKLHGDVFKVLTPEQKEGLKADLKNAVGRRGGFMRERFGRDLDDDGAPVRFPGNRGACPQFPKKIDN